MTDRYYIYGIIGPWSDAPLLSRPVGAEAGPVEVLTIGGVNIVASTIADAEILPVRRNTVGHTKVLEELIGRGVTVLPMRFGLVMDSLEACRRVIMARETQLLGLLEGLEGKIEVGITVRFNREALFQQITAERPAIGARSRALKTRDEVSTYHDRVALGQEVERLVRQKNEADRAEIMAQIAPLCVEHKPLPFKDDMTVMRAACLVRASAEPALYGALQAFSKTREPRCDIAYLSPVPAYNFVRANLDWGVAASQGH